MRCCLATVVLALAPLAAVLSTTGKRSLLSLPAGRELARWRASKSVFRFYEACLVEKNTSTRLRLFTSEAIASSRGKAVMIDVHTPSIGVFGLVSLLSSSVLRPRLPNKKTNKQKKI